MKVGSDIMRRELKRDRVFGICNVHVLRLSKIKQHNTSRKNQAALSSGLVGLEPMSSLLVKAGMLYMHVYIRLCTCTSKIHTCTMYMYNM